MRKFSETDPITGDSIALDDPFFVLNKSQTSGPQSGPGGTVRSVTKQQLLGRGSQVIRLFLPEDATQIGLLSRVASHIDDIPTTADTVITRDTYFWVQLFIDGVVTDVYFQNIKGFGSYGTTGDLQFAQTFFNPIGLIQHFPISTTIFVDNDPNNTPNSLTEVVNILNASDDIPITTFGNQIFYVVNGVPTVYEYTGGNTIIGSGQTPIVEGDLTVVDGVVFDATPQDFQTSADQVPVDGTPEFHALPQGDETVFGWLTGNDKSWGWLLQQYGIEGTFGGYYESINGAGTNLFNSQGSQVSGRLYLVRDASFDTNVTTGFGLYKYLGTTVGDLTDYELQIVSAGSSLSYDITNLKVVRESDPQAYVEANDIALLNARTTGIRFGGQTSVNGGLGTGNGLDILMGAGQILDNTDPINQVYTSISWTGLTNVQLETTTPFVTYWYFDDNSNTVKQTTSKPTRDQFSTRIYIAVTSVTNGIITGLQSLVTPTQQLGQRIAGLANALGILREDGLNVQTAGANLNVKVSSGRYYKYGSNWNASNTSPDNALFAGIDTSVAGDIRYVIPSGIIATDVTEYDVANYAPNGTVTAIPGNLVQDRFGYHFLIGFPGNNEIRAAYGSTFYTSMQDALDDLQNIDVFSLVPSAFKGAAFLIGVLIIEKDATDIDQALADGDAVFKTTNTFGFFGGGTSQAGSGFLEANLNLSDLTDVTAALNNLFGVPANDNQVIVRDSDGSTRYEDFSLPVSVSNYISKVNSNKVNALHRLFPITTPTYDSSGQSTHPSVIYFKDRFNGFRYWMAHTPYPNANQQFENPSILVSNNGEDWTAPDGLVNPIVPSPSGDDYNADTDIIYGLDGKLYVYYIETVISGTIDTKIKVIESSDGITWGNIQELIFTTGEQILSPSVIVKDGRYHMYFVDNTNGSTDRKLIRVISDSPNSGFLPGNFQECTVSGITDPFKIWHIDVNIFEEETHIFHSMSSQGNSGGTEIFFGKSLDGINFTTSSNVLLARESEILGFENRIYRGSGVLKNNDTYEFYYGIVSNSNEWRIAKTDVFLKKDVFLVDSDVYVKNQSSINPEIMYATSSGFFLDKNLISGGGNNPQENPFSLINLSYTGNSFSLNGFTGLPIALRFNDTGDKLYVLAFTEEKIIEFNLSQPFNITSPVFNQEFVFAESASPTAFTFSPDGLNLYLWDNGIREVLRYNLSVAFDISTLTFQNQSTQIPGISSIGIEISSDGSKIYVTNSDTNVISEFSLTNNFDVTDLSQSSTYDTSNELNDNIQGLQICNNDTVLVVTSLNSKIFKYDLGNATDLSTISYLGQNLSVINEQTNSCRSFVFSNDGLKGFAIGDASDLITEYL